ncbi:hypothetical protein CSAL01_13297 [Colletotrichum salicis]|uniref:Uncharacterized protein n=1 Tax=Colletotrichum salicis TaxID=1209931 RepID=A0A135SKB4_9PEZI|nr:hypothetical protein CSAL01_13297 [Colletotrichum salicis]
MLLGHLSRIFLLLALGCLSTGAQARLIIGYRTASEEEALQINEKNTPFRDPAFDNLSGGSQIGNGIYLGSEPAGWRGSPIKVNWYCVFKADEDLFMAASKIWIPQYYQSKSLFGSSKSKELWGYGEKAIAKYIGKFNSNPDKTLRFSYIEAHGSQLQMVIPTKMANADSLDFFAKCFETRAELLAYEDESVNWWDWDISGDPGHPG